MFFRFRRTKPGNEHLTLEKVPAGLDVVTWDTLPRLKLTVRTCHSAPAPLTLHTSRGSETRNPTNDVHKTQRHGDECKRSACVPFCHSTQVHSTLAPYCNRTWLLAERIKFLCVSLQHFLSFLCLCSDLLKLNSQSVISLKNWTAVNLTIDGQLLATFRGLQTFDLPGVQRALCSLLPPTRSQANKWKNYVNNQSKICYCYSMSVFTKGKKVSSVLHCCKLNICLYIKVLQTHEETGSGRSSKQNLTK